MSASEKIGKFTGKLVKATKVAPNKTGNKLSEIKEDLVEGYRSVVPAKIKNQDETA